MEATKITLKIKHLADKVYDVEVETNLSVYDLKVILSTTTGVPAEDQKLIYRGII
jgi:hypothetical protein